MPVAERKKTGLDRSDQQVVRGLRAGQFEEQRRDERLPIVL
jgi:hypothetical protein